MGKSHKLTGSLTLFIASQDPDFDSGNSQIGNRLRHLYQINPTIFLVNDSIGNSSQLTTYSVLKFVFDGRGTQKRKVLLDLFVKFIKAFFA